MGANNGYGNTSLQEWQWTDACAARLAWTRIRAHAPSGAARGERRRQQSVSAHALLRDTLGDTLGIHEFEITRTVADGPVLRLKAGTHCAGVPAVGLAHCTGFGACAVATGEAVRIGVDVETLAGRDWEGMQVLLLHPLETTWTATLDSTARASALLGLWCGKEALLKAVGTGIDDLALLAQIGFSADGRLLTLPAGDCNTRYGFGQPGAWRCAIRHINAQTAAATVWQ